MTYIDEIIEKLRPLCQRPVEDWPPEDIERERALLVELAHANKLQYDPSAAYWMKIPRNVAPSSTRAGRQSTDAEYWGWHTWMDGPDCRVLGATLCHRRLSSHLEFLGVPEHESHAILEVVTGMDVWRDFLCDSDGRGRMREFHDWYDPTLAPHAITALVRILSQRLEAPCARTFTGQVLGNYKLSLLSARRDPGSRVFPKLDDYCWQRARKEAREARAVRRAPPPRDFEEDAREPRDTTPFDPTARPPAFRSGQTIDDYLAQVLRWLAWNNPRLADCLRRLPTRRRFVVLVSWVLDLDRTEVAELLETTSNNVGVIRHRALLALRQCVREDRP